MSVSIIITGDKELDAKLAALPEKTQKKYARSALSQGMTIVAKAAKRAAPVGPTGNLRRAIGKRFKRIKQEGITQAKVGINVGKRAKLGTTESGKTKFAGDSAPHGHLVALGTKPRYTGARTYRVKGGTRTKETGNPRAYRGVMPANHFFRQATESVASQVETKMIEVLRKKIIEEANR